jgi:exodeoxyribonuclease V alpha subunit
MNSKYARLGLHGVLENLEGRAPSAFAGNLAALCERAGRLNLDQDAVHLAAEIAALEPSLDDDARYAVVLIVLLSLAALQEGSTRLPITGREDAARTARMMDALIGEPRGNSAREAIAKNIERLLHSHEAPSIIGNTADARTPLLFVDGWLYHQRIHAAEARLAENLARMLAADAPARANSRTLSIAPAWAEPRALSAAIDDVTKRAAIFGGRPVMLTELQRAAVATAVGSRLATVSGGPGTGKTSIVVAILRVLARLGVAPEQVALAAPTGKAAYRMRELIAESLAALANPSPEDAKLRGTRFEPATVHRLLGYSPSRGSFRHHRNNPLAQRVVIVDEGSMLDLLLIERLAGALRHDAQLIILGDADQLPSVAAGAVFRDLVPASLGTGHPLAGNSVRLEGSHRTASAGSDGERLRAVADAIKRGESNLLGAETAAGESLIAQRARADDLAFAGVEFFESPTAEVPKFLGRWESAAELTLLTSLAAAPFALVDGAIAPQDRERIARLFGVLERARILTVLRAGPAGAEGVNARMHERAGARAGISPWRARLLPGEPVMLLRNDYEHMLFNGDQGVVVTLAGTGDVGPATAAVFVRDGEFVPYRLEALQDRVALSYAITVHKGQGSEFDSVAIVLPEKPQPDQQLPILTREVLYTAVTRARRSVVLVGRHELIAEAIANPIARYSGLAQALGRASAR